MSRERGEENSGNRLREMGMRGEKEEEKRKGKEKGQNSGVIGGEKGGRREKRGRKGREGRGQEEKQGILGLSNTAAKVLMTFFFPFNCTLFFMTGMSLNSLENSTYPAPWSCLQYAICSV